MSNSWKRGSGSNINREDNPYPKALPEYITKKRKNPTNFVTAQNDPELYKEAVATSYEGFVVDPPEEFAVEEIRSALQVLDDRGFFRVDVTQPFGLGSKLAPTYVTRCLLGRVGATYKYLGLRMFAVPWNPTDDINAAQNNNKKGDIAQDKELVAALRVINSLNCTLEERTAYHLLTASSLCSSNNKSKSNYDITLINKMDSAAYKNLKEEPMFKMNKCSVSWHADSSLEHHSSIAVYHTIFHSHEKAENIHQVRKKGVATPDENDDDWGVGLRVWHDAEGPTMSAGGGGGGENSIERNPSNIPPIKACLPSDSTYYMLGNFNHHHQHAVLAPSDVSQTIRFSSTHRLLREGQHNVTCIIERCTNCVSNFHRKGIKLWRTEQKLLNELESEWLRQFYIQGSAHHDLLYPWWKSSLQKLLAFWSVFEQRSHQTISFLLRASAASTADEKNVEVQKLSRKERKEMEKNQKALSSFIQMLGRSDGSNGVDTLRDFYEPFASHIDERADLREKWIQRESNKVFGKLSPATRPIPFPAIYGCSTDVSECSQLDPDKCYSPMECGSPEHLRKVCRSLRTAASKFSLRSITINSKAESLIEQKKKSNSRSQKRKKNDLPGAGEKKKKRRF